MNGMMGRERYRLSSGTAVTKDERVFVTKMNVIVGRRQLGEKNRLIYKRAIVSNHNEEKNNSTGSEICEAIQRVKGEH